MKKTTITKASALALLSIFLVAEIAQISGMRLLNQKNVTIAEFSADKYTADIDEPITFLANITGQPESILQIYINFGDGNGTKIDYTDMFIARLDTDRNVSVAKITHKYANEGVYQVTLRAISRWGNKYSDMKSLYIEIINEPPQFDIAVTNDIIVSNAVYNFEGDTAAPPHDISYSDIYNPEGWEEGGTYRSDVRVIEADDGVHSQVMELYSQFRYEKWAENQFSSQDEGLIEFWYRKSYDKTEESSNDNGFVIQMINQEEPNIEDIAIDISIDGNNDDKIRYHDGSNYKETGFEIYNDYEWIHIKLDFNCSMQTFNLFINGFLIGENLTFRNQIDNVNTLRFTTKGERGYYIDSVGYSWEQGYEIGDNFAFSQTNQYDFNEDEPIFLFITNLEDYQPQLYRKKMRPIWNLGDGFEKQGSLGVSYNYPEEAEYNVSATVIDEYNAMTTESKKIRIKNLKPQAGFKYSSETPSSINFNRDAPGETPIGWLAHDGMNYMPDNWFDEHNIGYDFVCDTPEIMEWKDGFYKAAEFRDESDIDFSAMQYQTPRDTFGDANIDYGTYEFWFLTTDASKGFRFYGSHNEPNNDQFWEYEYGWDEIRDGPIIGNLEDFNVDGFNVRLKNGVWQYSHDFDIYDHDWTYSNFASLEPAESNKWTHIRIDYNSDNKIIYNDLTKNQLRLYVNGNPSEIITWESPSYYSPIDNLGFMTNIEDMDYSAYIDAIGFSWDSDYNVGENWKISRETYKATYDFRFEPYEKFPSEFKDVPWIQNNSVGCNSEIIPELDNHYDVLNVSDYSSSGSCSVKNILVYEQPNHGTVEFWFRSEDVSQEFMFNIGPFEDDKGIAIRTRENQWEYYNQILDVWSIIPNVKSPENDVWQHLRIDFECRDGDNYQELSKNEFVVIIDNEILNISPKLSLINDIGEMEILNFETGEEASGFSVYIDAIGYSWDNSYTVGTNLHPIKGFYDKSAMIFTANDNADTYSDVKSLKYYWLFGDNTTGYGKGTIHEYQESGIYNVTLIIEDDNGIFDIFSEEVIVDNRPPEVHFLPPFHKASINFEGEEIGEMPDGWKKGVGMDWMVANTSVVVQEEKAGHRNVLAFEPVTRIPAAYIGGLPLIGDFDNYYHLIEENATVEEIRELDWDEECFRKKYGSLEFHLYIENRSNPFVLWFMQTALFALATIPDGISISTVDGKWYLNEISDDFSNFEEFFSSESSIQIQGIPVMQENTWNHIRIDWCCDDSDYMDLAEDTFQMWVNNDKSLSYSMNEINYTKLIRLISGDEDLVNPVPELYKESLDEINLFNFFSNMEDMNSSIYIDNLGFSWDPNYELGDNMDEPTVINEGETFYYETYSYDGISDYMRLSYDWGFASELNMETIQDEGWSWTYQWYDDEYYDENLIYVRDTEGVLGADYYKDIQVNNVEPTVGLHTAYIPCNISMDILTSDIEKEVNFTLQIFGEGEEIIYQSYSKPAGVESISEIPLEFGFETVNNYDIILNQTYRQNSSDEYYSEITLNFGFEYNGEPYLSSSYSHQFKREGWETPWILDPDSWWVDEETYTLNHPIRFFGSVYDPSSDDVYLDADYGVEWTYLINHDNESLYNIPPTMNETLQTFDDDEIDNPPSNWVPINNVTVSEWEGTHVKVVNITDSSAETFSGAGQFFPSGEQAYGTMEFDIFLSDMFDSETEFSALISGISFVDDDMKVHFNVGVWNGTWMLSTQNSSGAIEYINITDATVNRWEHVCIDFELTTEEYKGLSKGTYQITINEIAQETANLVSGVDIPEHIGGIVFFSMDGRDTNSDGIIDNGNFVPYNIYFDNVIYSWTTEAPTELLPSGEATYTFNDDIVGAVPNGWLDYYPDPSFPFEVNTDAVSVQASNDEHENYVNIADYDDQKASVLVNEFDNQTSGTIEFWIRNNGQINIGEQLSMAVVLISYDGSNLVLAGAIGAIQGMWASGGPGSEQSIISGAESGKWYHMQIDFECSDGNYTGLGNDEIRFTIDGIYSAVGNMSSCESINQFGIYTEAEPDLLEVSLDDVGYSWDPEYEIGDNYYDPSELGSIYSERFMLNGIMYEIELWEEPEVGEFATVSIFRDQYYEEFIDNDFPVDLGFNFDILPIYNTSDDIFNLLANIVGLENLTIIDRIHSNDFVRITATDDDGGKHIQDFNFNTDIKWPSYSFDEEELGTTGTQIEFVDLISNTDGCGTALTYDADRESKVLMLEDNTSEKNCTITNYFFERESGEISFWWKVSNIENRSEININSDEVKAISLRIENGSFYYYDVSQDAWEPVTYALEADVWYHHKIAFSLNESGVGMFDWFINDNLVVDDQEFGGQGDEGNGCHFQLPMFLVRLLCWLGVLLHWLFRYRFYYFYQYCQGWWNQNSSSAEKIYYLNNIQFSTEIENSVAYTNYFDDINYSWAPNVKIRFDNFAPIISSSKSTLEMTEDVEATFSVEAEDLDKDNLTVWYDFGDGSKVQKASYDENSTKYSATHLYENHGTYLVTVIASDGLHESKIGSHVIVKNVQPFAHILGATNVTEDQILQLDSRLGDSPSDVDDLRYWWDFGDGTYSYDRSPTHAWADSGTYEVHLFVRDNNGALYNDSVTITVFETAPVIEGPFIFSGVEGNVMVLDVAVHDSWKDEMRGLDFLWEVFNPDGSLYDTFTVRKPTLTLNDGNYSARLTVTEQNGLSTRANITIKVQNIAPTVFVSSKVYYGNATDNYTYDPQFHARDFSNGIEITAYTFERTIDYGTLVYECSYTIGENTYILNPKHNAGEAVSFFLPIEQTGVLKGTIKVWEEGGFNDDFYVAPFNVFVMLDNNGNGYSDELEASMNITLPDQDEDGLINFWEIDNIEGLLDHDYDTIPTWLDWDADNDGLPDGYMANFSTGEIVLGTDPLVNDTDGDILLDGFEFFGWSIQFQRDAGEGYVTIHTSSDPLVIDTDGDGIDDYEEYLNGTNPTSSDTDLDGIDDLKELELGTDPNNYDSDGDGISDGEEYHGYIVKSEWGLIKSNYSLQDTDRDGFTDYQEIYGLDSLHPTNPTLNDTDGEGLLDTQEVFSVKKSLGAKREVKEDWNSFSLSFPNIEKAQSASMTLSVSVGEATDVEPGKLDYNVELNGDILYEGEGLHERYFVNITDITEIVETHSPNGYGGTWTLNIWTNYSCLVEEFSIDVAGYLDPLNPDTDGDGISDYTEITPEENRGWSTNPFYPDSDGDGWEDGYEIYGRGVDEMTNPWSTDTDGDGVSDPKDLDPRRDCLVQVTIVKAGADEDHIEDDFGGRVDEFDRLKVGLKLGADFDYQGLFTESERTDDESDDWVADFNDHYYFDINDDVRTFTLKDVMLFGQLRGYHSRGWYGCDMSDSHSERGFSFSSTSAADSDRYGSSGSYYVDLHFSVVTIEHAHVIAVYENGSYSEEWGRYYEAEKMAVLQIEVIDTPAPGSPFVKGANTIVIPSSTFLNSQLNSIVQRVGDANETEWAEDVPACLKGDTGETSFQGIDRENMDETMSDQIEIVISKKDCTAEVAMQLLNLTLTGLLNETTGETGIIFLYDGNATHCAALMNLPHDVVKIVPLFSTYKNSPTGGAPDLAERLVKKKQKDKDDFKWWEWQSWVDAFKDWWDEVMDFFEDLLEDFLDLLSDLVAFVEETLADAADFIASVAENVKKTGLALVEAVKQAVMAVLEGVMKGALLALIYLIFSIRTILYIGLFKGFSLAIEGIGKLFDQDTFISSNSVSISFNPTFSINYEIRSEFFDWLDLYIPSFNLRFLLADIEILNKLNFFMSSIDLNYITLISNLMNLSQIEIEYPPFIENDFMIGIGDSFEIFGRSMCIAGSIMTLFPEKTNPKSFILLGFQIATVIATIILIQMRYNNNEEGINESYIIGLIIGSLISISINTIIYKAAKEKMELEVFSDYKKPSSLFRRIFQVGVGLNAISSIYGLLTMLLSTFFNIDLNKNEIFNLISTIQPPQFIIGLIWLGFGSFSLNLVPISWKRADGAFYAASVSSLAVLTHVLFLLLQKFYF